MNEVTLTVEPRSERGSAESRRMRASGKIPATIYGLGEDPRAVTVARSDLRRALSTAAGVNALIRLDVAGESTHTLVKEIQRHPVRRDPIHVDFIRIDAETPMELTIPVVLTGEAKQVTSNGGMVEQRLTHLLVSVRPDSIPNELRQDISGLEIDTIITVGDLRLPNGVSTDVDPGTPVVAGSLTRAAMDAQRAAAGLSVDPDSAFASDDAEAASEASESDAAAAAED